MPMRLNGPFRKALSAHSHPQPRVINTDLASIFTSDISAIENEAILRQRCRHRPVQYLNNIIEQNHRAIKRQVNAKQEFRDSMLAGERFRAVSDAHDPEETGSVVTGNDVAGQIRFIGKLFGLSV